MPKEEPEVQIAKGLAALDKLVGLDPELREQTLSYIAARDKLRDGMKAMLEYYARHRHDRVDWGLAREEFLADIAPLENDLSYASYWTLGEAIDAIVENAAWENKDHAQ